MQHLGLHRDWPTARRTLIVNTSSKGASQLMFQTIAAPALALSPITVVTNRNNTIDSTLMLVLLLAAWATFRAIETDRLRWLVLSGALVAVGFNIKMLEAYLVVPAFALAYLLSSNK